MEFEEGELNNFTEYALDILKTAHIVLPKEAKVNIYHHYGINNISNTGAMFINVVNREYCKSIVVMQPDQKYPSHYHRIKRESFYVLHGELIVTLDGEVHRIHPGEMLHVERGQDHSFATVTGTVFEEISTMYVPNDSVYLDSAIASKTYVERRTTLTEDQWKEIVNKC